MKPLLMIFCLFAAAASLHGQALDDGRYPNLLDVEGKKFIFTVDDDKGVMEYPNGCTFELVRLAPDPKKPSTFVFVEVKPRVASEQCTTEQKKPLDRKVEFTIEPSIKCSVSSNGKMRPPQRAAPAPAGN